MRVSGYQAMVSQWMEKEAQRLGRKDVKRIARRAREVAKCGKFVNVRQCEECGELRPGSGLHGELHTCGTKGCLWCSWKKAKDAKDIFEAGLENTKPVEGYRWQFIVQTIRYDPRSLVDVDVPAIRSRALLAAKLSSVLWQKLLKVPGAGMLRTIECSARGHVHVNFVYYGPVVDAAEVAALSRGVDARAGVAYVKSISKRPAPGVPLSCEPEEYDDVAEEAAMVAFYVSKGMPGSQVVFDEDFLAGERDIQTLHPRLAARWDMATYRVRLFERYGVLRAVKAPPKEDTAPERQDDSRVVCECCGHRGAWRDRRVEVNTWHYWCHSKMHSHAMEVNGWKGGG